MFRPVVFAFLLTWTSVFGEKCVSNNFESDFNDFFRSDEFICFNGQPWQLANYSSIDIADVPKGSNRFIEPRSLLTCESTPSFHMNEGVIEVKFYTKIEAEKDYLSVIVSELISDGHRIYAHRSFSRNIPDHKNGWNTIRIDLTKSFNGFISFMGEKSEDSILLIDSFRYFDKDHEDNCKLYGNEDIDNDVHTDGDSVESTTESPTKPDPEVGVTPTPDLETPTSPNTEGDISTTPALKEETTAHPITEDQNTYPDPEIQSTEPESSYQSTTNPPVETERCVTYNFDNDFDKLFTHDHDLCGDFNKWELNNYNTSNEIDTANAKGSAYLVPSENLSCISAFPIRMSPEGLVEVNVYIEPASPLDYIIVLVKNIVHGSVDTVAGSIIYEPGVKSFVRGWNVLRINVVNLRSFDGYLILLGAASEGAVVLVDSFRYVPPWADANAEECQIP